MYLYLNNMHLKMHCDFDSRKGRQYFKKYILNFIYFIFCYKTLVVTIVIAANCRSCVHVIWPLRDQNWKIFTSNTIENVSCILYMKWAQNKDFNILHLLCTELSIQMEDLSVLLKRALLYFDKNKYLLTHLLQT